MKNIKLILGLSVVLLMAACTKETTIKEEYNPPQPKLYGTWKMINLSVNTSENYFVFDDDGNNFAYMLTQDVNGFRYKEAYTYKATDKQLSVNYSLYNYTVSADTLTLYTSPTAYTQYLKINTPTITPANWTSKLKILKTLELPRAVNYSTLRPFGVDGDYLFLMGNNGLGDFVFKFNTLTKQHVDSISVASNVTTYYKSPNLYYAFEAVNKIFKTVGIAMPATTVSTNDLNYTRSLSMNASSGVVFAFTSDGKLYSGTDGSNFSAFYDFYNYGLNYLIYDQNDEFIALRNGVIYRLKISPSFSVTKGYDPIPNFYTYGFSSNGIDTWVYGYNNMTSTYQLLKVGMN